MRQPGHVAETIYSTGCLEKIPSEEFEACFTQALPLDMTLKEFPCYFDYNLPQFASLSDCNQEEAGSSKASHTLTVDSRVIAMFVISILYGAYLRSVV